MPAIELQNAGRRQLLEMFEWEKCRLVLKTAIPLFVNFECIALIGLVDIYLAGLIGPAAQASVGLGDQLLYLTTTVASGLSVATCAITARLFGAGRYARIRSSVCVSLTLGTVCGITAMLIGLIFAHRLLSMFSNDPEVIRL